MLVKFLRGPRILGGVKYELGVHEVPDQFFKHWFLLALISNGDCLMLQEPVPKVIQADEIVEISEVNEVGTDGELIESIEIEEPISDFGPDDGKPIYEMTMAELKKLFPKQSGESAKEHKDRLEKLKEEAKLFQTGE